MILLTKEQVILLHEHLINRYGGSHGVRDEGLLDSALNAPLQGFGGLKSGLKFCSLYLLQTGPYNQGPVK